MGKIDRIKKNTAAMTTFFFPDIGAKALLNLFCDLLTEEALRHNREDSD